jgi:prepilin-type N-terminal cleavage/methylation domain-containing protein
MKKIFSRGFIPLQTIGRQKRDMMSVTGFTLVEVMISLFILGLGMVSLFNLFPLAWQSLSYSRKLNEVVYLAENKLEGLKSKQDKIEYGQTTGKEGDLNWTVSARPLKLTEDIEVIYAQLDIDFSYQNKPQKERFITYLFGE